MGCHSDKNTIICCPNIYKYPFNNKEYYFEWHYWCGPIPVNKKTLNGRKTIPTGFYKMIDEFIKLSEEERKEYIFYF